MAKIPEIYDLICILSATIIKTLVESHNNQETKIRKAFDAENLNPPSQELVDEIKDILLDWISIDRKRGIVVPTSEVIDLLSALVNILKYIEENDLLKG